ncbi:MAG: hypothetical protein V3T26_06025 [candidate division NC10 bacterium]
MTDESTKGQQLAKGWPGAKSLCSCGHTGDGSDSAHKDSPEVGHGACLIPGCPCNNFTWARWMTAFEAALGYVQE